MSVLDFCLAYMQLLECT